MNRLLAFLLVATLVLVAVAPPKFVPQARADDWRFDLNAHNITVVGEGDPDTPDLTGMKFQVLNSEGAPIEVDPAWLLQILAAAFGNWFNLID